MSLVFLGLIAYVLMQFAIGAWVPRRIAMPGDDARNAARTEA